MFWRSVSGRLIISNNDEKLRASQTRHQRYEKKYYLNDLVKGDVIFCAAGVTDGEMLKGIRIDGNNFLADLLVLHSEAKISKIVY